MNKQPPFRERMPILQRANIYFVTEGTIARRLGISEAKWRAIKQEFEREGMPRVEPLVGRRYWPAVKEWFDGRYRNGSMIASRADGEEKW